MPNDVAGEGGDSPTTIGVKVERVPQGVCPPTKKRLRVSIRRPHISTSVPQNGAVRRGNGPLDEGPIWDKRRWSHEHPILSIFCPNMGSEWKGEASPSWTFMRQMSRDTLPPSRGRTSHISAPVKMTMRLTLGMRGQDNFSEEETKRGDERDPRFESYFDLNGMDFTEPMSFAAVNLTLMRDLCPIEERENFIYDAITKLYVSIVSQLIGIETCLQAMKDLANMMLQVLARLKNMDEMVGWAEE
ncbi:hypothetical protein Scep_022464 [Stephania cephalantha]|uniref:Uncharacterized protein n=1 Tax=Stephania cephalantha TaxID=152367 RepID=A0AAP0F805_9MAGN